MSTTPSDGPRRTAGANDPVAPQPRGTRRTFRPREELFALFAEVARYRCLTGAYAHALVLRRLEGGGTSERAGRARIKQLVDAGYLATTVLAGRPPLRFLHLTRHAFTRFPALHALASDAARKAPPADLLVHAASRVLLRLAAENAGFEVGRDLAALSALRRFLVDQQTAVVASSVGPAKEAALRVLAGLRALPLLRPYTQAVCDGCGLELSVNERPPKRCLECGDVFQLHPVARPHICTICRVVMPRGGAHLPNGRLCPGALRLQDALPFDLAHRRTPSGYEVQVLFVDNPYRSISAQLAALPLRVLGQPRVPIVVRPSDDGSLFDAERATFVLRGPRLRSVMRALCGAGSSDEFPFSATATVLPDSVYPQAHFRVLQTLPKEQRPQSANQADTKATTEESPP